MKTPFSSLCATLRSLAVVLAAAICLLGLSPAVRATTFTNIANGNWSVPGSWGAGGPAAGGGSEVTNYFISTATDLSTNDLAGGFWLNQLYATNNQIVSLNSDGSGNYLLFTNSTVGNLPLMTNASTTAAAFTNNIAIQLATNLTIGTPLAAIVINSNITETTRSQLIKAGSGTLLLNGSNVYSGGTVINGGTLTVNSNAAIYSPSTNLIVGALAGVGGTNTLNIGGAITVQQILVTNLAIGSPTNSIFNFNGGTLTTSNNLGLAANILIASNSQWNIGGNWIMNGGTNIVMNVHTNTTTGGSAAGTIVLFINESNGLIQVNPGAVLLSMPVNAIGATNTMQMYLQGFSNRFVVNGGQVIWTNRNANANLAGNNIFNFNASTNDLIIITNGGFLQTYTPSAAAGVTFNSGSANNANGIYVAGTNAAGNKSAWISGGSAGERFNLYGAGVNTTNWLAVDSGGVVSNVNLFAYNYGMMTYVTNGGAFYNINGMVIGRNGNNCQLLVAGADGGGNKATVTGINGSQITVGGGTATQSGPSSGSNCLMRVDVGGVATNSNFICVGQDTNSWNNTLIITNGGQVYCGTAVGGLFNVNLQGAFIGYAGGCFSNTATVGGGTNLSWLNLGGGTLGIGNGGVGATNNSVTLLPGGILTNLSFITFGAGYNPSNGPAINSSLGQQNTFNHTNGGTLALNGANVLVSGAGTYNLNGVAGNSSGGTLTFANGALFAGNGTNGGNSVVMNPGSLLAPGGLGAVGTLALGNNLALNSAQLYYDLGGTSDLVTVGNTLTASGVNPVYLSFAGTLAAGNYPLMIFTNTSAGLANFALASGNANASLALNANTLVLQVAGNGLVGSNDVWKGSVNGTWDTSTANWNNGVTATNFLSGDTVVFDDTLSANPVVTAATPGAVVTPGAVTFNNNTTAYTINANIGGTGFVLKNGTGLVQLTGTNSYSGNTMLNAGVLMVTNGGAINSPQGTLFIGNLGTNLLGSGGSITVQSIAVANNATPVMQNPPAFLLNLGGTLTTSNNTGVGYAANILLTSNASWSINGTWNLNAGTNLLANVSTNANGNFGGVYIGNAVSNALVMVNSNAVLWSTVVPGSAATNIMTTYVGNGNSVNDQLVVNGGTVYATNLIGTAQGMIVGNSAGSISNQLVITNGGQVYVASSRQGGPVSTTIGTAGLNNSLYVAGTNGAGRHSLMDFGRDRLIVGNTASIYNGTNNWVRVDQGGVLTNVTLFLYSQNSCLFVTNGGQFYTAGSSGNITVGRNGVTNQLIVWGADPYGNPAYVNGNNIALTVGGGSAGTMGSNNLVLVGPGGIITNMSGVNVGGSGPSDTNNFFNGLVITNGGQLFGNSGGNVIGYATNCNNNFITVGGGTNTSLWNLNFHSMIIGNVSILGVGANNSSNNYAILYTNGVMTNVTSISLGGVNSAFYFNGGMLAAGGSGNLITTNIANGTTTTNALNATNFVQAGGAIINDSGYNVTNQLVFTQDPNSTGGGLSKLGTGTLALQGVSTYTGSTIISAGNLAVNNTGAIGTGLLVLSGGTLLGSATCTVTNAINLNAASAVSANIGQILTLTGFITNTASLTVNNNGGVVAFSGNATNIGGNVTLSTGAQLAPGGVGIVGALNLTNNLTLNSGTLFFDVASSGNDLVAVGNTLTANGVNTIYVSTLGQLPSGNYTLMTFGSLSGTLANFTLAGGNSNCSLALVGNTLVLQVVGGGITSDTWKGYQSGTWDTSALNWTNTIGGPSVAYVSGDAVLFDDTLVGNSVIGGATLSPGSVTFNNSATNYIINAAISGTGSLVKNGTATVTLAGVNNYASNTVINAGTLVVTNGGTITSPSGNLVVGTASGIAGTLTLTNNSSAISVQALLATNVPLAGAANSIFNLNGGTLTTSNGNGVAANILLASNASWNINGNWRMLGGTNYTASAQTAGGSSWGSLILGNGITNTMVIVSNAFWSTVNPYTPANLTNYLTLYVGNGSASSNNVLNITNGGQVFVGSYSGGVGGPSSLIVGNSLANYNGLIVAGANGAGQRSWLDAGNCRLIIGTGSSTQNASLCSSNNWLVLNGGVITNVGTGGLYTYGLNSSVVITNGGQFYLNSGQSFVVGREGETNNYCVLGGSDAAGNPSAIRFMSGFGNGPGNLLIGGNGGLGDSAVSGTNCYMIVGQGGLVTNANQIVVANDTNAYGHYLIITNGGQVFSSGNSFIGNANSYSNCVNNYLIVGGAFGTTNSLWNLGGSTLTLGGSTWDTNNTVTLLSGGLMTNVSTIFLGANASLLKFNGGTLAASASGYLITNAAGAVNYTNYIQAGGAIINDSGYNVTIALPLTADSNSTGGGLTKLGGGSLTLTATNTYTGLTTISAGTLLVTNNVALNTGQVVLNGGALFAGGNCTLTNAINLNAASSVGAGSGILTLTGFITNTASLTVGGLGVTVFSGNATNIGASVTLSAGAQLAPGGLGTVGALNLTNNLTLNGGTLLFDVTGSGNDLVAVGNTLAASGVTTIFVSVPSPLAAGTSYTLMTFTNNTATLANFVLAGVNTNKVTLALTANTLVLQVVAGTGNIGLAGDTWKGYQSGTWDSTVLNWTNASTIVAYADNDSVIFDDTLVGNPIITNAVPAGVVSPAAVTFNNNLTNYVINANIGGTNTLNKYGVGVVTLGGTNNFTGGINLYVGTLVVTNDRSLGASNVAETITMNGSGTLQVNGSFALNTNRVLNITGAGGSLYYAGGGGALYLSTNQLQGSGPLFLMGISYTNTAPLSTASQPNYSGTIIVVGNARPGVGANNVTNPFGTGTIYLTNGNGGNVGSEMFNLLGTNCVFGNTFVLSGIGAEGTGLIRNSSPQIFTNTIILTNYPYASAQINASVYANSTNYYYGPIIGPANFVLGQNTANLANTWNIFSGSNTYTGNTTIGQNGSSTLFMIGGTGSLGNGRNYAGYITNYGGFVYGAAGSQTLSGIMSGPGSNMITAGILTLTASNSYTGSTFVNGGELLVNGNNTADTGTVQVNMGILGGTGIIGGNVNVSGILAAGGTNNIGTLTLTNNVTLNGGVLLADLSNVAGASDLVTVGGTLTLNSANLVSLAFPNGPAPAGTYTLMTYAAKTGSGTLTLNGSYPNTILTVGPTSVTLTVSSGTISSASIPTPFNWNGNVNGSWDINTTANWLTNGTSAVYLDGNVVTFDDTATSYTVSNAIGATFFSPGSVSVLNIQNPYTISANIGGAAAVTKAGGNVLTLTGNNTFSGSLTLNSGTLNLNSSNYFSGGLTLNFGTLNLNNANGAGTGTLTINGGTVDNASGANLTNAWNNALTWSNSFTFGGTANLNLGTGTATLYTNVTVTGASGNTLSLGGNINLGNNYLTHAGNGGLNSIGVISGTGGVTNLAGQMYFTNNLNTYSGITYLGGQTNYFTSIAPVNGGPSSFGNPSSVANGVLYVATTLYFIGTGTYTSDRVINNGGGFTIFNNNGGTLILSGGITNGSINGGGGAIFRGNSPGVIVETGPLILGGGILSRTDSGTVVLTNMLNSFTNYVNISVGTFVVDTLANAGVPCSLGAGAAGQGGFIQLGQVNTTAQGILQFVGTNGTTCNRNIYLLNGGLPTDGGCLSNTVAGNTVNFSGNISVGNSITGSTVTNVWTSLGLGGAGNGVISGTIGGGTTTSNHLAIVKTGTGTWTLSGVNTNNGPILVNAGALFINGNSGAVTNNLAAYLNATTFTNSVTVAGGAMFGGSGIIGGSVVFKPGAILMAGGGAGTNANGSLTLMTLNLTAGGATYTQTNYANSALTLNGNTLAFNLFNNGTCNQVLNGGNLTNNGVNLISLSFPSGPAPAGTYTLMTNAATYGSGTFALAGSYTNVTLSVTATNIQLVVGAGGTYAGSLTWKGYVNGIWNINASANWSLNGTAATYADGNAVLFDDTLLGSPIVNSAAPGAVVSPGSVTFNNNATSYIINANMGGLGSLNMFGAGTATLAGTNSYAGNTTINAGTLVVTNGGSIYSPNAVLNIGPTIGSGGTNTLLAGGVITVQSLLMTNITFVATNSVFNFNGGTLTTSNKNGVAANVLLASNVSWNINGSWNMNGGTNIFANIATNGGATANVYVGNNVNNAQVMVNPGAVWWSYGSNTLLNAYATNVVSLFVGGNNATNNQFVVNGGTVIITNYYGQNNAIIVGVSAGSVGNQLIVTNGGQVYLADLRSSGPTALNIAGGGGTNNGVYVGGTNSAGAKSFIDTAQDRLAISSFNNWVRVDQGGLITNVSLIIGGNGNNAVYITNGGVIVANYVTLGRGATNDTINIAGADSAGNLATMSLMTNPLVVGGAYPNTPIPGNPGTNCAAIIGQGGQITNWNAIYVGGGVSSDSNCVNNILIITNGGQLVNAATAVNNSLIGFFNGCNTNSISLGGGSGTSLWNLGSKSLTIGYNAFSTNNFMTLFPGGIMTNFSSIIFGGYNSSFYQNGGILAGNVSSTAVSGSGTLVLNGDASLSTNMLTLSGGVLLAGNGTNGGSVVLNAGASLAPAGVGSIGKLTLTNNLTLNGGTLFLDVSSAANDLVAVGNNLTATGVNSINLAITSARLAAGSYTLMTFANVTGTLANFALGGAFSNTPNATLVLNATSLVLQVGGSGLLGDTWKGYQSGVWDTSTLNWTNLIGSASVAYADGDAVLFDDTLVGNSVISGGPLAPGSMFFNNSLTNYLINATISGTGVLTKSGAATVTLAGANTYASNTVINAGTLVVTNGGAIFSPNSTLNIGAQVGSVGTLTMTNGAITVKTLLATNLAPGGGNTGINSVFNFNGGTLTTSNNNGLAANFLVASNAGLNLNGIWNANAGTNIIVGLNTNGGGGNVYLGNGVNGAQLNVNSGAVWWHQLAAPIPQVTNEIALTVGINNATNTQLMVNGGTVIITNGITTGANGGIVSVYIGSSANSVSNQVVVTNGGQLITRGRGDTGFASIIVGNSGTNYSSMIVGGTNAAGGKSLVDFKNDRLQVGNNGPNGAYAWVQVGAGGVITNANVYVIANNCALYVTNGGQLYVNSLAVGRYSSNSVMVVGGTDASNSKSLVANQGTYANFPLTVGGASGTGSQPEAFNTMRIDAGGLVTNAGAVAIGGSSGALSDSNVVGNVLIITNGGQLFSVGNGWAGYQNGCGSNQLSLGGGSGMSLWNLGNHSFTLGNDLYASNNVATLFTGGVLTNVSSLILGGSYSVLNFNGGTLAAGGNGNLIATNSGTYLSPPTNALYTNLCYFATNYIQAGGAVIDSVTFTVTNVVPFAEDPGSTGGGLTKLGSGTLTLPGVNTYTGPTVVSAGTLALTGSASIANSSSIVLAGGTKLDVSGLTAGFTLGGSQTLSNSASTATINCGTHGFSAVSGTVALTYAAGTPSLTVTNGTLTLSGSTVFRVNSSGLLPGTYKLISKLNGGSVVGSLPAVTVVGGPGAGAPVLSLVNNELWLTVGGYTAWTYSGTSFTYNGAAQSPSLTSYSGSANVVTTNYVGVSPTSYGPSVNAPTNAGSYYVTNAVLSDANYFGFTNSQGFTIAQTNLTVTAQSNTKVYDGTTSAATVPLTGPGSIQSGDSATLTETYATPAGGTGKTLNPAVTITNAAGANVTASYNVTLVPDTTGVITAAPVTFNLFSLMQTNGYHDSVFFTATNLPVNAGSNVVFQANGLPFSTNNVVNGGTTSLTITNLPRGNTNVIIATYNGDGNYAAYVTNLIQTVTNHPPVAATMVATRTAGQDLHIFWSAVATNWSDADGDTVTNISINLVTTNGVTLQTNSALILYTNSLNVNDQFSYTIVDSYGDTNTGVVDIVVNNSNPFVGQENTTIISTNGGLQMTFYGVLGYTYVVQRNQVDITDTNYWLDFITNSVITNQVMIITDTNNPNPPGSFYRLKWQP